jgi:PAS domain S-box-containing protein
MAPHPEPTRPAAASASDRGPPGVPALTPEHFRQLFDAVSDGITVQSSDGRVVFANEAAARICGFATAAEFLSTPVSDVMARFQMLDEHDAPLDADRLPGRRLLKGQDAEPLLIRIRQLFTGKSWWTQVKASAIKGPDGSVQLVVNTFQDVTRFRREAASRAFLDEATVLLAQSLDYKQTLNNVAALLVPRLADWCAVHVVEEDAIEPVAVAHVDAAKVELAKDLQRRYPIDPSASHGVARVVKSGQPELYRSIPDALLVTAARDPKHLQMMRQLGLKSAICVPLQARDRTVGALTLVAAESDREYDEGDLAQALELARRAASYVEHAWLYHNAQQAVRLRDEFLSVATHELKTPLAALFLQLESLIRVAERGVVRDDNGNVVVRLKKTFGYAERLGRLVDDLLDVSRISHQRLTLKREPVDLRTLVQEVVERFSDQAARVGSELHLIAPRAVHCSVDRTRFDQVITNLIANALKYGAGNPIGVVVEQDGDFVQVVVTDHGIGVAPENQDRIFQRFERAVSAKNYGGLGLGLWIAHEIVRAHGGRILLTSSLGKGATFTVRLPCRGEGERG